MLHRFMLAAVTAMLVHAPAAAEGRPKSLEKLFAPLRPPTGLSASSTRSAGAKVENAGSRPSSNT